MPKSIADLPLLNEEDDEDEERKDGEEEKKLVSVLLQLKAAKSTLNDSRKKKQRKKVIEEVTEKFVAQSQALITKHNKRWTAKVADMTLKCKKLKVQTEDILQKAKGCKKEFQESINLHQNKSKGLLDSLKVFERNAQTVSTESTKTHKIEIQKIEGEVHQKLQNLQMVLQKLQNTTHKGDKIADLIGQMLASY